MTIRDIYNFYYGLNDKHFISITEIIPPNKGSYVDYILELKDNRYFDYLSINFFIYPKDKHQVTRISTLWCDNNSIKHDTKRDFNLGEYDSVSLYVRYVLKFEIKIFKYKLFEKKKSFERTQKLNLSKFSHDYSRVRYEVVKK